MVYSETKKAHTHIVLGQIRMVLLNPIIQDGDNYIFPCVAPLPGGQDVHLGAAAAAFFCAVLMDEKDSINVSFSKKAREQQRG